jgi:hypothetical protein
MMALVVKPTALSGKAAALCHGMKAIGSLMKSKVAPVLSREVPELVAACAPPWKLRTS